jgi:hypothetical protein
MPLSRSSKRGGSQGEEKRTLKECKEQKHQKRRDFNEVGVGEIDKRRKGILSPFPSKPTVP